MTVDANSMRDLAVAVVESCEDFWEEGLGALVVCRGVETEAESTVRGTGQEACLTFFLLMIGLSEAFFSVKGFGALVVCRGVETEGESTVRGRRARRPVSPFFF